MRKTDRTINRPPNQEATTIPSSTDFDVDELNLGAVQEEEPIKILQEEASFEEVMVWGHESIPARDDVFVRGVEEWTSWAGAMHSYSNDTQKS